MANWYDGLVDNAGQIVSAGIGAWDASQGQDAQDPYFLPGQKDAYGTGFGAAQDMWNYGAADYYPNSTVADRDPNITAGENQHLGSVGIQQQLANMGAQGAQQLAGGGADRIGGFSLPDQVGFGLPQDYVDAIQNPIWDQLQNQAIPQIHTAAQTQGAFGGSRMAQQKADATEQATTAASNALIQGNLQARQQSIGQRAGDISAQLQGRGQDINQNQIYNQALSSGTNALTAAQGQQLTPGNTQQQVGAQRTGYDQQLLNADKARWDYDEMKDENLLGTYFGWLNGTPSYSAGAMGATDGGDFLDIVQGGLQGANIGNLFAPAQPQAPNPTMGGWNGSSGGYW